MYITYLHDWALIQHSIISEPSRPHKEIVSMFLYCFTVVTF